MKKSLGLPSQILGFFLALSPTFAGSSPILAEIEERVEEFQSQSHAACRTSLPPKKSSWTSLSSWVPALKAVSPNQTKGFPETVPSGLESLKISPVSPKERGSPQIESQVQIEIVETYERLLEFLGALQRLDLSHPRLESLKLTWLPEQHECRSHGSHGPQSLFRAFLGWQVFPGKMVDGEAWLRDLNALEAQFEVRSVQRERLPRLTRYRSDHGHRSGGYIEFDEENFKNTLDILKFYRRSGFPFGNLVLHSFGLIPGRGRDRCRVLLDSSFHFREESLLDFFQELALQVPMAGRDAKIQSIRRDSGILKFGIDSSPAGFSKLKPILEGSDLEVHLLEKKQIEGRVHSHWVRELSGTRASPSPPEAESPQEFIELERIEPPTDPSPLSPEPSPVSGPRWGELTPSP